MVDQEKLKQAWGIFEKAKVMHFITCDGNRLFCRPMSGILQGGDTIYAATFRKSNKVAHLNAMGKGAFYVYDPDTHHYGSFSGDAEVGDDKEWREKLWHDSFAQYFPGGVDDENYVYIKLKIDNVNFVTEV